MNHKKLKNEYYKELYEKSTGKEIFLWIPFIKELFIKILELKDKKELAYIYNSYYKENNEVIENISPIGFILWISCPTNFDYKYDIKNWNKVMNLVKDKLQINSDVPLAMPYMREWSHMGYEINTDYNLETNFCLDLLQNKKPDKKLFNKILKNGYWTQYRLAHFIFLVMPEIFYDVTIWVLKLSSYEKSNIKKNYDSYIYYQEYMQKNFGDIKPYELTVKAYGFSLTENQKNDLNDFEKMLKETFPVIKLLSEIESEEEENEKKLCEEDKKNILEKAKQANISPKPMIYVGKGYYRDKYVIQNAKNRANGKCEMCNNDAPFLTEYNNPYLEVHHITPLAAGGEDTIENTIALCPNCHRKLHHSKEKEELYSKLVNKNNKG